MQNKVDLISESRVDLAINCAKLLLAIYIL